MVLVGGRLYALVHGVRQKVAHLGVAAGARCGAWMWRKAHCLMLAGSGAARRLRLILEWCCLAPLAVVPGRAAPLGVEIDAVVVWVPSHVVPVRKGYHRQWRRHLHACSLVFDTEYLLLHRLPALRLDKLPRLVRHRRSNARK